MLEWLLSWEVTSVVAVALAGIGLAFVGLNDLRLAKLCFLLAAADAIGGLAMWGARFELPIGAKAFLVFVLVGCIGVLAMLSLQYVNKKEIKKAPAPRAHIHVTKFEWSVPADEGGHASVKVIFVNDGNAPTTKVKQASKIAYFAPIGDLIAQRAFENQLLSPEPSVTKEALDAADNQTPVGVDRSFTTDSPPWTKIAIDKFLQGSAVVYIAGTIFYSDERATYKTTYCGFVGKDGNMKFCGMNNQEP